MSNRRRRTPSNHRRNRSANASTNAKARARVADRSAASDKRTDRRRAARFAGLPPTPVDVLMMPHPDAIALDGTFTVPVMGTAGELGWAVCDGQGRMVELLVFTRGDELVKDEHRVLDDFECSRELVGDPRFAGYDAWARDKLADEAPEGTPDYLSYEYCHHPEPAGDGTRSVLVRGTADRELCAWLVLNANGRLVDGMHIGAASPAVSAAIQAFVDKRTLAGDPQVAAMYEALAKDDDCGSELS